MNALKNKYIEWIITDLKEEGVQLSIGAGFGFETAQGLAKQYYSPEAKKLAPNYLHIDDPEDSFDAFILEDLKQQEPEYFEDDTCDPRPLTILFEQNPRMILVGDPGTGKTTSLLYLTLLLAANYQRKTGIKIHEFDPTDFENEIDFEESFVPFFFSLKQQHFSTNERKQLKISSLVAKKLSNRLTGQEAEKLAAHLIENNRAWLIFDGLDEMLPADRWAFLQSFSTFLHTNDKLPVTLSARKVGYPFKDLLKLNPDILPIFGLEPIGTQTAIEEIASHWLEQWDFPQAEQPVKRLVQASNLSPAIRKALANPMHLRMLLILYSQSRFDLARLPKTRFQLYEAYIKELVSNHARARTKMQSLEYAAWFLHGSSTAFAKKVLEEKILKYFPKAAREEAWFEEFSSLLHTYPSSNGEGEYLVFRYPWIREFFVARRLLALWHKGRQGRQWVWKQIVAKNLVSPHYHEILLLVLAELSKFPKHSKMLTSERYFHQIWQTASREFKRDLFSEGCFDPILALKQKDIALWLESMKAQSGEVDIEMLETLLLLGNDKDAFVREQAEEALEMVCNSNCVELLLPLLGHDKYQVRAGAAEYLGQIGGQDVIHAIRPLLEDKEDFVRAMAVEALGRIGNPSVIPDLLPLVEDESVLVPDRAVEALGEIGGPEAVQALLPLLDHEESLIRWYAGQALGKIGGADTLQSILSLLENENGPILGAIEALEEFNEPDAVQALEALLEHEISGVRQSATAVLVKIRGSEAVLAIRKLLEDDAYEAREFAAGLLEESSGTDAQQLLESLLEDRDARVRRRAAQALGSIGDESSVPALISQLGHSYSYMRREAAEALGEIGDPRAVEALRPMLNERDNLAVLEATKALGKIGGEDAVEALLPLLEHTDDSIRVWAVDALGKIGTPKAISALGLQRNNTGYLVWQEAAFMLGEINSSQAVEELLRAFKDPARRIHHHAAEVLENLGGEDVVLGLCKLLEDQNAEVRTRAVEQLGKLGDPIVGPSLLPLLNDSSKQVRLETARALGKLRDTSAVPELLLMLADEDEELREIAAFALAKSGDRSTIPALLQLLEDKDAGVQMSAVQALSEFKDPATIAAVLPLLRTESAFLRADATAALGKIGDPETVPALLSMLQDNNDYVRSEAARALEEIQYNPSLPEPALLSSQGRKAVLRLLVVSLIVLVTTGIAVGVVRTAPQSTCQAWPWLCTTINRYLTAVVTVMGFSGAAAVILIERLVRYRTTGQV